MILEELAHDGNVAKVRAPLRDHQAVATYFATVYSDVCGRPCHANNVTGCQTPRLAQDEREYAIGMGPDKPEVLVRWDAQAPRQYMLQDACKGAQIFDTFLTELKRRSDAESQ